jgi:hypothetical protein
LLFPCREGAFVALAATGIFCPLAGRAFTFFLDKKSKQKNQDKTNPQPGVLSGLRACSY